MPYAPLLTDPEIDEGLRKLPDWERDGEWIVRTIRCPTFPTAIELVDPDSTRKPCGYPGTSWNSTAGGLGRSFTASASVPISRFQ